MNEDSRRVPESLVAIGTRIQRLLRFHRRPFLLLHLLLWLVAHLNADRVLDQGGSRRGRSRPRCRLNVLPALELQPGPDVAGGPAVVLSGRVGGAAAGGRHRQVLDLCGHGAGRDQ